MEYNKIIETVIKEDVISTELISNTSNEVYKVKLTTGQNLYLKIYKNNSSHIDNEIKLYDLIDNKYLKELYYKSQDGSFAIFKELEGDTIDELNEFVLNSNCEKIVDNVCNYFNDVAKNKIQGYGILDNNLKGKYEDFLEFLKSRQEVTSTVLKNNNYLNNISSKIFETFGELFVKDNSLVPIDTNMKNIMLLKDGNIKFIDPGEMISGHILMGYGDFVAHTYNTPLYNSLINKLQLNENEEKLLRIYAIFSSLNILAFLKQNGVEELDKIIPYGNKQTFYSLIDEHLGFLNLK